MKFVSTTCILVLLAACSVAPSVQQEHMIIAPHTIVLSSLVLDSTVSITHSCTCPFSWNATVSPVSPWLVFEPNQSGDKTDIPISIDTSLLTADTSRAKIYIVSNSYGEDSILVTAIK
jgi:hypothetical protein